MAIEAEHYEAARVALMADPIITAMAADIGAAKDGAGLDINSWSFTTAAMREYLRRGGTIMSHIGGPAEAIRRLLDE